MYDAGRLRDSAESLRYSIASHVSYLFRSPFQNESIVALKIVATRVPYYVIRGTAGYTHASCISKRQACCIIKLRHDNFCIPFPPPLLIVITLIILRRGEAATPRPLLNAKFERGQINGLEDRPGAESHPLLNRHQKERKKRRSIGGSRP